MPNTQAATRPTTTTPKQGRLFEMTPEREQEVEESFEAAGKRREKFNTNLTRAVAVLIGRTKKTPSGRNLTRHDMAVLYCDLLTMGGPNGWCYRTDGQLAEELGSHPSTVNRSRRKLRECGFIAVAERVRGRGNQQVLGPMLSLVADMVKASEASTSDQRRQSSSDHVGRMSSDQRRQSSSDHVGRMSSDHVGQSVEEDIERDTAKERQRSTQLSLRKAVCKQLDETENQVSQQELANVQQPRPLRGGAERSSSNEEEVDSEQDACANQDDYSSFAANDSLRTDSLPEHKPRAPMPTRSSAPSGNTPRPSRRMPGRDKQRNLNGTKQARTALKNTKTIKSTETTLKRRTSFDAAMELRRDSRSRDYDNQNNKLANRLALIWPHLNNKQQQTLGEEVDTLKSPQETGELDAAMDATKQVDSTINNLWETLNLTERGASIDRASKLMHNTLAKREVAGLRQKMRRKLPKRLT